MLVFWSGGIDSTTLAFDLARHPYRYGVTVTEDAVLTLVTAGAPVKKKQLAPLLAELRKVAVVPVEHIVKDDGLRTELPQQNPGMPTVYPMADDYLPAIFRGPYTAGWLLWMAAVAANLLYDRPQEFGAAQAFVAHQWNGPEWLRHDAGDFEGYDCSPEFYRSLNETLRLTRESVVMRAPFMEWRLDRGMVVQLAQEVGVPLHLTSSCIYGWRKNCGTCGPCMLRQWAFRKYGVCD